MFLIAIQKKYLDFIRTGQKVVEGRLFTPKYKQLKVGQVVRFYENDHPQNFLDVQITSLNAYPTFREMLEKEGLPSCLPGIESLDEGVSIYHQFPNYQTEETLKGALAIGVKPIYDNHISH